MKRLFFYIISFLLFQQSVLAIHPFVRNFSRKTYKGGTQNWDIIQPKNDWMYFANNSGLLEYDGNRWTVYPISNETNVRSLYYDQGAEKIYAGAFNEFGYYTRNKIGVLVYHSLKNKISVKDQNFNEIWNIYKADDIIYFQGDKEVFRYRTNKIDRLPFQTKIECSAVINNTLFVSSIEEGVSILNGDMFLKLPNSDLLNNKKVCAILPYQENKVLFVTDFYGIYIFDGIKVESFKTNIDKFLSENQVFCAAIKGDKLAFGTVRNGLVVKDLKTGSNLYSNTLTGLQNNTILSLAFDKQDNLWLGLDKGIDYVLINSPIYDLFGNSQFIGSGYTSLIRNNTLYLGTNQGLYTTNYPLSNSPTPINANLLEKMQGQVWSLISIDNTIFCGTDHGAYIIEGKNAYKIPGVLGTWSFIKLKKHPNCILASSYQGFFILKKENGKWKFSNFVNGFSESGAMFEEDKNGDIWFSHWIKGIYKLSFNENLDSINHIELFDSSKGFPTNRDNTLCVINDNIIFSTGYGFYVYNYDLKKIEKYPKLDKLFGNLKSRRLYQTSNGNIWSVSASFVGAAILQKDKSYVIDSLSYGSLKNVFITGFENFDLVDNNNVIVSTEDGFSWLDLSKAINPKKKSSFKVSIRNVYLTNDSIVSGYIPSQKTKETPEYLYKDNSLRFEFVAPEYRNEASVTYSYLLENYDTKWSAYSSVNTKEYTKLKKGTYTFRVRAKSLLEANTVETSYEFTILPPWYESKLAFLIYFILFVYLVIQLLLFIKKRSEQGALEMKEQKELEMKEQEERFQADTQEKEKEIVALRNQKLQYELRHKSQELASSTMNLIRKNEILFDINQNLDKLTSDISAKIEYPVILKRLQKMQENIKQNIQHDNNWKRFEQNFDMVYENYLKRLGEHFPSLTISDKKLCAYLKMGLSSKDIAPLLNMSFRSVEMCRYRLRKKMDLNRDINLTDYLQNF